MFAVAYTIAYLALSIPAVAAGIASNSVGLRSTAIVYSAALIVLCGITFVAQRLRRQGDSCPKRCP